MNFDLNKLETAGILFEKEPMLIKIENISNCVIVGDTHGDYESSKIIIDKYIKDDSVKYLIFLGDYVDRGQQQIENINFLIEMKIQYPEKLILLRGNHEFYEMNENYGFLYDVLGKYNEKNYDKYLEMFSKMPIAFYSRHPIRILGVHGGIPVDPTKKRVYELSDINKIKRYQTRFDPDDLITQIVWNDPKEKIKYTEPSYRGAGYHFGEKAFSEFMDHNDLEFCIRSHEKVSKVRLYFKDKLYNIFTCKYYGVNPNYVHVDAEGMISEKKVFTI